MSFEQRAVLPETGDWLSAVVRGMLPWLFFLVLSAQITYFSSPVSEWSRSYLWWVVVTLNQTSLGLPFLLFPAGVAIARVLGHSWRALRIAIVVGLSVGAVSYSLAAWVEPSLDYHLMMDRPETAYVERFGPDTPVGVTGKLRYVEENPPGEYHLSVQRPEQHPPNVLRWFLHQPVAMAAFGLVNVILGMLAAQLTVSFRRAVRRNTLFAIGVASGIAFFLLVMATSPIPPFLRDGTLTPGVAGAWLPLSLPIGEALLLYYLVGKRRYRRHV